MAKTVPATVVDDIDDHLGTPGAVEFRTSVPHAIPDGMAFVCPCGCGREGWLPFKPEPSPSWNWNGNSLHPTLTPSVQQVGGCRWHGWLEAGVWRDA
jgi:hypothetical protein